MQFYEKEINGWGRYPKVKSNITDIYYPIENLLEYSKYDHLIPRGLAKSYGDASLPDINSLALELKDANKFLNFDKEKGIIEVMSGMSLSKIMDFIIPHGWFLPTVPGTRLITIGGALGSNIHGKNHHKVGSISEFVSKFEIVTEKGKVTCTPHENKELFYSSMGGYGLTGVITKVELRLKKIETAYIKTHLIKAKNYLELMELFKIHDSKYEHSVAWIDCLAKGKNLGRGIAMFGNHLNLDEMPTNFKKDTLHNVWNRAFKLPPIFPDFTLNPISIKLFNFGFYNKQRKKEVHGISNFEKWFFPLDFFTNWNILYGKSGFTQYQFAIPFENGEKGISAALEFLSKKKIGSFLAVLKVVKDDKVLLPFAIPGFTLALDIPLRNKHIFSILDELDKIILEYGGRIYLTKDARLSPETFRKMYPDWEKWLNVVKEYSPNNKFYSLMAKRLEL